MEEFMPDVHFMSLRLQSKAVDIALRLPPLFLMDQLLLYDMGMNFFENHQHFQTNGSTPTQKTHFHFINTDEEKYANATKYFNDTNLESAYVMLYGNLHWVLLPHLTHFFGCLFIYLASAFVVTLSTRQLLVFYTYLLASLCAPVSYTCNKLMLQYQPETADAAPLILGWFTSDYSLLDPSTRIVLANGFIQLVLACLLSTILWLHLNNNISPDKVSRAITMSMLLPSFLAKFVGFSIMRWIVIASLVVPMALTAYSLWQVLGNAFRSVIQTFTAKRQFIANFGLNTFIETEWVRLRVPSLLRTFWLTRFTQQLLVSLHVLSLNSNWNVTSAETATKLAVETMILIAKDLLTRGAETILAVLGLTSVVSTVCHYIGAFFHIILTSGSANAQDEEEKSVASVSAVLFFVLALQTGLTSLEPDKRFARLCKNLCLLVTALFHFIHNMVNPVLMSLSASHNLNSKKHVRALGICAFLVVTPLVLMIYLWQYFYVGTWLLAVSAFCIEVIIKVVVTIAVYALFLYDARAKDGAWEGLDDAVYYVKAVGNSIEFCFAVFLFFNGGWILFFESGGTIRVIMMLIHAYCNIYLEAKSGWRAFIRRRTAVEKINSLPNASTEDLTALDDVCSICYQEMTSAKITPCRHFFHVVCLRKWLYMQDTCPLCHSVLYATGKQPGQSPQPDREPVQPEPQVVLEEQEHDGRHLGRAREPSSSSSSSSSSALGETSSSYDEFRDDLMYDSLENYNNSRPSDFDDDETDDVEEFSNDVQTSLMSASHSRRRSRQEP